jgi:signal recognition particle subunit SRP54
LFHPDRMASRILGMGDVVSLVEKVEAQISDEEAKKVEEKLRKAEFTFDDFLTQLGHIKKMGSMRDLLSMIPGVNSSMLGDNSFDDKAMARVEAIVHSMTKDERRFPSLLNGPRRARIAIGSGTSVQEVNRLVKQFTEMQKMIKKMSRGKMSNQVKDLMKTKVPA